MKFVPMDETGKEGPAKYLPIEGVEELFAFGSLDANSALFNFLGQQSVVVHYFDYYENYTGSFMPRDYLHSGKMLIEQVKHFTSPKKRQVIANQFINGATYNMLRNLKYYLKRGNDLQGIIDRITILQASITGAKSVEELMGIEGNIRMTYYEAFDIILKDLKMEGRSKQPPKNEVNALISFGNMMCYTLCLKNIYHTQLNPTVSYLHSPGERRYSLALDLAEIFKPILVDRTIFKILNKRTLQAKDFDAKTNRIHLKEGAKKKFIEAWEERLSETIQHRSLKRKVSYKHLVKLECYKLAKHVLGMQEYKPFKALW